MCVRVCVHVYGCACVCGCLCVHAQMWVLVWVHFQKQLVLCAYFSG